MARGAHVKTAMRADPWGSDFQWNSIVCAAFANRALGQTRTISQGSQIQSTTGQKGVPFLPMINEFPGPLFGALALLAAMQHIVL
jgi:hypothetical protein